MKTPSQDYQQPRATSGEQKVILNEKETAETDELDPQFSRDDQPGSETTGQDQAEPGDDPKTELI